MGEGILIIKLKILLKQTLSPNGNKILSNQRNQNTKKNKENAIILLGLLFHKLIFFLIYIELFILIYIMLLCFKK
jgi:hypothetical protein